LLQQARCPVIVGRDEEIESLDEALFAASRGNGRVVALAGDAGLGKTRLAGEVARRAGTLGMTVLWGGCAESDLALPYLPFLEAIGNWMTSCEIDRLRDRLGPSASQLAQLFPSFGEPPAVSDTGDAAQAKLRLYEALVALLRIAAGTDGLLVVVEDIHWADSSTRDLLNYMTRRIRGAPIMILVTYRNDELHRKHPLLPIVQAWRRSREAEFIEIEPLVPESVARMVEAIFEESSVSAEFRDFMHERSEGNPFVLEELLKEAVDRGDIYRTEDGWDRKKLTELRVPRSVSEGILLRVERLPEQHAEVLQAAAVLGQTFTYPVLVAVTGLDQAAVQEAILTCVQQQLLDEDRNSPGRYRFRHAITRESIYDDMIAPRRQELHARAADVLQAQATVAAVEVAQHLMAAGKFVEAVPWCIAAGDAAMAGTAFVDAKTLYECSLPYVTDVSERAELLGRIGEACATGVDLSGAEQYLTEAIETLERVGERSKAASRRLVLGRVHWVQARPVEARAEYERARHALEPFGPSVDLAVAYIRLSGLASFDTRSEEARALAEHAMEVASAAGADEARIWAAGFLGLALVGLGREQEGVDWMTRSIDEGIEHDFFAVAQNTLHNAVVSMTEVGRAKQAESLVVRLDQLRSDEWRAFAEVFLRALIYFWLGRLDESEAAIVAASRVAASPYGWSVWGAWSGYWTSTIRLEQGRIEEVRESLPTFDLAAEMQDIAQVADARIRFFNATGQVAEAADQVRAVPDRGWADARFGEMVPPAVDALVAKGDLAFAEHILALAGWNPSRSDYHRDLYCRARISSARGNAAEGERLLRESIAHVSSIGYRLEEARARLALAEVLVSLGDREAAATEIGAAIGITRACRAGLIEREAIALAERLGVPVAHSIDVEQPSDDATPEAATAAAERLVTVMFADVRGYTAMTNLSAPADMAARMTSFYAWARREIEHRGGSIDQYLGDAIMASFNVRRETMDHTVKALDSAVAMHDRSRVEDLPLGIGIATGAAIVGNLTGGIGIDVIGQTTNLAARLQAQAEPGEILLDAQAYRRVEARLTERGLAVEPRTLTLKGYDGDVPTFSVRPRG
jgi:class 3 adenylate cyclase